MCSPAMLCTLVQNLLFRLPASFKVAIHSNLSTSDYFCHVAPPQTILVRERAIVAGKFRNYPTPLAAPDSESPSTPKNLIVVPRFSLRYGTIQQSPASFSGLTREPANR